MLLDARPRPEPQEVPEEVLAHGGEDAFGMELHALERPLPVPEAHHDPPVRPGGDLEALGDAVRGHHQRVVARGREGVGEAGEEGAAIVADLRRLPVHELGRAHHAAAESLAERLVAETDAEHGHGSAAQELEADARLIGGAGPRGDHDLLRLLPEGLVHGQGVVPDDLHLRPQLAEVLVEVERERVVVVDEQDHASPPAWRRASKSAPAFAFVSRSSAAGSESATIPAPACRVTRPPRNWSVRIAMQKSRLPRRSR